eukprot:6189592-Pleurochrysis_carterae.AAC.5
MFIAFIFAAFIHCPVLSTNGVLTLVTSQPCQPPSACVQPPRPAYLSTSRGLAEIASKQGPSSHARLLVVGRT